MIPLLFYVVPVLAVLRKINRRVFVACEQALLFGQAKLRRSLARSHETRFTYPNRRACSQASVFVANGYSLSFYWCHITFLKYSL